MNNDLISISEAKSMGATCLARRNENGQLEAIISLDNAQTVEYPFYQEAYQTGYEEGQNNRQHGKWIPKQSWDNTHIWVCSECGNPNRHGITVEKACWKCGVEMRGEEE